MTQPYRLFGRTGMRVSPIALGTMMFGATADRATAIRLVDQAIDAGINIVDTANGYGFGLSEEIVGEALRFNGQRSRIVVCTKVHFPMSDEDPNMRGNSRRHIIEQAEASLRRLGVDYIDLYQIHRPEPETAIDETLRALDDLVHSGKVRYIGCSTFAGWQIVDALWASHELGLNRFVSEQSPYNILDRRIEREVLPAARNFGMAVMAWSPLAGGLLSGKYSRTSPRPPSARYSTGHPFGPDAPFDRVFEVAEAISSMAQQRNIQPNQLALAWNIQQPGITCAIIGPRNEDQLRSAIASVELGWSVEDSAMIDQLVGPGTHILPYHRANFGPSAHHWS